MSLHRIPLVTCLGFLCGFLLSGCGSARYTPGLSEGARKAEMREVKKFDAFRIYYAGEEVAGLPLTIVWDEDWQRNGPWRRPGPSFGYGRCKLPNEGLFPEGGCSLPLSIQNWSRCSRWPGQSPHGHRPRVFDFRGAKAAGGGGEMEIFTGQTTVVIFGSWRTVNAATRQLRDVRQANSPAFLPRPAPGSLWGNWPCQRERRLKRLRRLSQLKPQAVDHGSKGDR